MIKQGNGKPLTFENTFLLKQYFGLNYRLDFKIRFSQLTKRYGQTIYILQRRQISLRSRIDQC